MKWLCMDWNQVCRRHHTVFCKVLLLSIGTWRRERAGDRDRERARRKRVERKVCLYSDFLEFNRESLSRYLLHYHLNDFFKCLWKKQFSIWVFLKMYLNELYYGSRYPSEIFLICWLLSKLKSVVLKCTVFLNCFGSILECVFFLETISSDLWTISFVFTSDWNFLLIWANCKCFGTCVQTVSTIVCSLHNNWFHMAIVDSHLNRQTLHNFSIIFHHVSHHIPNDPFNYQKLVYTHVYYIHIWHWNCL